MRISSKLRWIILLPVFTLGHEALALDCDITYVSQSGKTFTVMPTGGDDTANIQCAFDEAVAAGPGATVELTEGTFHTAQIVVKDFAGQFLGASKNKTVVQNLDVPLEVDASDLSFFIEEPSADNKWPTIFAFIDHVDPVQDPQKDAVLDVMVSDMTIRAVGEQPTQEWTYFNDLNDPPIPPFKELAHAIVVLGPKTSIHVENVHFEGEEVPETLYGFNLFNAVYPVGGFAGYLDLMEGAFTVKNSSFRNLAGGAIFDTADKYRAIISHNEFDNVYVATEFADILRTHFEFSHNRVNAVVGVNLVTYGGTDFAVDSSSVIIKSNRFQDDVEFQGTLFGPEGVEGGDAVTLDSSFGDKVHCRLLDNDISTVEGPGDYPGKIYLGPDTHDCGVINSGRRNQIVDEGTDNVIIPGKALGHWLRKKGGFD